METCRSEDFKSYNNERFTPRELDILEKNKRFFSANPKYISVMLEIINGESIISIRLLDWFVSNYSKKYNTYYKIKVNGREEYFYVNNEYKNQLNGYSKQYFDPFCRKKKIIYTYHNKLENKRIVFISSIGQLNFFQWSLKNKVITYVQRHLEEIEKDMKETSKLNREKKMAIFREISNKREKEVVVDDLPDPVICSSDKINSVRISPISKKSNVETKFEKKYKRQQLSRSVYDYGIKKSNVPIRLDFE
ncbi:MAG: hypothetical protein QXW79_01295 [Thermoplasmata archaeon]